ncbi:MAG: DnaA/Hda family protein, partial [Paracoccus sp. (in: a-proteobacteria)]|nr:DnaA/Hda family protein [Paracoccus sp. (in: a-proteobacteria)]
MQKLWDRASDALREKIGANNHTTWIVPLRLMAISGDEAMINTPTRFISDWVQRHYAEAIREALSGAGAPVARLNFRVAAGAAAAPRRAAATARSAAGERAAEQAEMSAPLDSRFTFDNFVVGKPNELAHAAARRVAEGGPVTFNPLFLYGGVGLGKTHLMHAIASEIRARRPECRVLYLSAEQFMYRFVQALRERTVMDFKEMFRTVEVLMVDDV